MSAAQDLVTVAEEGHVPYAQTVTIGRHVLTADEPRSRGGQDAGPSPYEFLSAGLGVCTVVTIRMFAQRHGWPLVRTTVELWHERIPSARGAAKSDHFHRAIHLEGRLTKEQRARLIQVAGHCPVSETLRSSSVIDTAEAT